MLKYLLCLALLLPGCTAWHGSVASTTATPKKRASTGQVRLALFDNKGKVTEKTKSVAPGHFLLKLEGTATVVVVAFSGNQGKTPDFLEPQVIDLKDYEHSLSWDVLSPKTDSRLYVVALPVGADQEQYMRSLLKDWQEKGASRAKALLHQQVMAWSAAMDPELAHQGKMPPLTGGLTSFSAFTGHTSRELQSSSNYKPSAPQSEPDVISQNAPEDWHELADSLEFSVDYPGVYSYPIRMATK